MFRILLIEDPAHPLDDVEEILQNNGKQLVKAETGLEAIEALQNDHIGLVIVDLHTQFQQHQNPIELIRNSSRDTYIIFVTDRHNIDHDIVLGLNMGAVDYLIRPLNAKVVLAKVQVFERLHSKREALEEKSQRIHELLLNILPKKTAEELEATGKASVRSYPLATVLFTDFKGFTKIAEKLQPPEILQYLNRFFSAFDYIIDNYYLEKIKTIGDAYMAVGGIPIRNKFNPVFSVLAALEIRNYMEKIAKEISFDGIKWELRIGLHSGPLIAGVVGTRKWQYDVWGDTVNTAARIETQGKPGKVNISGTTYAHIKDYFDCTYRGKVKAKYKGELDMYFVDCIKAEFSNDREGKTPNEKLRKILSKH